MSLSDEAYLTLQMQLTTLAGLVREMPLSEFIERINKAESVGPILDPTLYRAAAKKLETVKDLAQALTSFQRVARKMEVFDTPAGEEA